MTIECLPQTDAAKSEWNAFVAMSPAGSAFATTTYLDALGARYDLWVLRKNGVIDAGLPLARGIGGLRTNPLYCKYLGLLPGPRATQKSSSIASADYARVEAFADLLKGTRSFDYFFHPSMTNWMGFYWLGFRQQTHFTYVIPRDWKESWWDNADSRLRRSARRGSKGGVRIREGRLDAPADVEACYALSMAPFTSRGARPLISRERFGTVATTMMKAGMGRIWLAEEAEQGVTSAALVLYDWASAYFVFNGTAATATTGTNSTLLAHIIEDTLARGLDFDFEGSMIKPIEAYYRLFGPQLRPYYRIWSPTLVNLAKRSAIAVARSAGGYSR